MAKGQADLDGNGRLHTGDAIRTTATDKLSPVADDEGAEVLLWTTGVMR